MARPSGDAAAGVSWSHPGGGCFAASGEGVKLGAMRVGRRGRGFCCSVASSAGAGATLRLGPIVEAAQMAAQQRLPRLPQAARTRRSSKARSRALINCALQQIWRQRCCSFGSYLGCQSHQLCISQNESSSSKASGLRCTHQYGSLGFRSRLCRVCFCFLQNGFSLPKNLTRACGTAGFLAVQRTTRQLSFASIQALRFFRSIAGESCIAAILATLPSLPHC